MTTDTRPYALDGIRIDYGPSGGPPAPADPTPQSGNPQTSEGDPPETGKPASQGDGAAGEGAGAEDKPKTGDEEGGGSSGDNPDTGVDKDGLYRPETVEAIKAAAIAEGKRLAVEEARQAQRTEAKDGVKTTAKSAFDKHAGALRTDMSELQLPAEAQTRLMNHLLRNNNDVVDAAFDVANSEWADEQTALLGEDATEYWKGLPEQAPANVALKRFAEFMAPKTEAFTKMPIAKLIEARPDIDAYIQEKADTLVNAWKLKNRPETAPEIAGQRNPPGGLTPETYRSRLAAGETIPAKDIDAMTAQYARPGGPS